MNGQILTNLMGQSYTEEGKFSPQMFAELIIQECAALAKSKSEHIEGIKTEDHDDQVILHSLAWRFKEFEYEIKKHFGVES